VADGEALEDGDCGPLGDGDGFPLAPGFGVWPGSGRSPGFSPGFSPGRPGKVTFSVPKPPAGMFSFWPTSSSSALRWANSFRLASTTTAGSA
jgi:hypothetical protein